MRALEHSTPSSTPETPPEWRSVFANVNAVFLVFCIAVKLCIRIQQRMKKVNQTQWKHQSAVYVQSHRFCGSTRQARPPEKQNKIDKRIPFLCSSATLSPFSWVKTMPLPTPFPTRLCRCTLNSSTLISPTGQPWINPEMAGVPLPVLICWEKLLCSRAAHWFLSQSDNCQLWWNSLLVVLALCLYLSSEGLHCFLFPLSCCIPALFWFRMVCKEGVFPHGSLGVAEMFPYVSEWRENAWWGGKGLCCARTQCLFCGFAFFCSFFDELAFFEVFFRKFCFFFLKS